MSTWNEYKEYVRETDPEAAKIIAVAESEADSISALIETSASAETNDTSIEQKRAHIQKSACKF